MYRRPKIEIKVDRWNWKSFQISDTIDLTSYSKSYSWQKTIKSPASRADIALVPQRESFNVFDDINIKDVVKIYEFGKLKFVGYVKRLPFTGYVDSSGKPYRSSSLICESMGQLFAESTLGLGLGNVGTLAARADAFINASKQLQVDLGNAIKDGLTYSEALKIAIDSWYNLMNQVGASAAAEHLQAYVDTNSTLDSTLSSVIPRSFSFFTGEEQSISLWQILSSMFELPLNEAWLDTAPRDFYLSTGNTKALDDDKLHLVFRRTPFDGYVESGITYSNVFSQVPAIPIQNSYLTRLDVAKSAEEVYSVYDVIPADFVFNNNVRYLAGQIVVDENAIAKYLLKVLTLQPTYCRASDWDEATGSENVSKINDYAVDLANTYKNWYTLNDTYLSGVLSLMVPDEVTKTKDVVQKDPRLGDRITLQNMEGSFYAEGVAHTWRSDGPLVSNVTVTRGYDYLNNKSIKISNKLFRLGLFTRVLRSGASQ